MSLFGEVSSSTVLFYLLRYFIVALPVPSINVIILHFIHYQKHVYSVRVVPSKQHTCRCNSTGEDKNSAKSTNFSFSELNTLVWEHRANFSAINYFKLCIFCSEGFLLSFCALDGLRYFILAIPWPSI